MAKREILLPNPLSYVDYINKVLIESFVDDVPTKSQVQPTTTIAKVLVHEDRFLIIEEEE